MVTVASGLTAGWVYNSEPSFAFTYSQEDDDESSGNQLKKDGVRYVGVFLNEETTMKLNDQFKVPPPNPADKYKSKPYHVIIQLHASDEDIRVYAPLYGVKV